jgi:hypothetical protein
MRAPWGPPKKIILVCMCSPSCYSSIPCHLDLNDLDFSGYNKIKPDLPILRLFLLIWELLGVFKAHEGSLGTPNQYTVPPNVIEAC